MTARGIAQGQTRAFGEKTSDEVAREVAEENDKLADVDIAPDRERNLRTPGFARMRTDWRGDDRFVLQRAKASIEGRILTHFSDAYEVINAIYEVVRTPEVDPDTGEVMLDQFGFVVWKKSPSGMYEEDFTKLTRKQAEAFLFTLTTRAFAWGQVAGDAWGEAMLSKGLWEERFSAEFDRPVTGTVDDRTAAGRLGAVDERYLAIYMSWFSRRCDALVRSMETLALRLRDYLSFS
jgi:hypothetical protein